MGGYVTYRDKSITVVSIGTFTYKECVFSLIYSHYAPHIMRNPISISNLVEQGYTFSFRKNKVSIKLNN